MITATTNVREIRAMIRRTNKSLYAATTVLDYNVKVGGIITQHGSPIVATTGGKYIPVAEVTAWIDGRNGNTL